MFTSVGGLLAGITHDYAYSNYLHSGDTVVVEGTSTGRTAAGAAWHAGLTHAGR